MTNIVTIEGIGPVYAEKLTAAGAKTVEGFLEMAKDPKGRKSLAEATGIDLATSADRSRGVRAEIMAGGIGLVEVQGDE